VQYIVLPPSAQKGGSSEAAGDAWAQVAKLARERKIPVHGSAPGAPAGGRGPRRADTHRDDHRDGGRISVAHGAIREREPVSAEELFRDAKDSGGLWLALDSLQDPMNIGAIFRTAAFFGVCGIVLTSERSAPLSAAAYEVASGGIEHVPFTLQVNLQRAFETAKESGLWILGTSEHAHDRLEAVEKDRAWLVVLGNEERGMRRLTEESCDLLCRIDPKGKVTSLNVSVAAGIVISRLA
jgi:23S rRNA (guanosine2251-2'-O)-methyltransferase